MTPAWVETLGLPMDPNELLKLVTLTFGRSLPTLFLNPFLGGQMVPAQVKMGTAAAFAVLLLPQLLSAPGYALHTAPFGWLMAKELVIGLTLGFLSSIVFWSFATAGRLIDTQRGANMAETMVYQMKERTSFLGQLYLQVAIVVFLLLNGHHLFIRGYVHSFELLPVWTFPSFSMGPEPILNELIGLTGNLFVVALQLAAPAVIALFLTDVAFGILNRAAPQVNVFNLSQPVKMGLGLLLSIWTLSMLLGQFEVHLAQMVRDLDRFLEYLQR
ncbi:MAG: flagellar biosynthetic protein FliR [Candidatus Eisenbacteria bacterium]|nr:flagellar biosynthetic protein FliR [Candidatus Eisenbacteria bacterium]MCC7144696.1 flagellar biosynthetic protein FliR [Candidatus Eisenbacteria bacterium]